MRQRQTSQRRPHLLALLALLLARVAPGQSEAASTQSDSDPITVTQHDTGLTTATERVFNFPDDKSYGRIYTCPAGTGKFGDWTMLGEAKGEIVIPEGQWVRFSIAPECPVDPSPFEFVGPDDIYELGFDYDPNPLQQPGSIRPENIARILHDLNRLTGLRELSLRKLDIRDDDLRYISDLKRLEWLSLESENFSDAGMEYVVQHKLLRSVSISGGITDAGLKKLLPLSALEFVRLDEHKVSKVAIDEFMKNRPDCEVFDYQELVRVFMRRLNISPLVDEPMPVF